MTVRVYISNAASSFTPTTVRGDWTDATSFVTGRLGVKTNAAATKTRAVVSSTDKTLLYRGVSLPLGTSGTIPATATVSWAFGVLAPAGVTMVTHVHIFVTQGTTDTLRGTLLTNTDGATSWTTTATGRGEVGKTLSSLAVTAGDCIVVEIGYKVSAGTSGNATINYGNTGSTDLTDGSVNVTTEPGWVEFKGFDTLFYTTGITASTFIEGFNGSGTFTTGQSLPSNQMYSANTSVTIGNGTATFPVNSAFNSVHSLPSFCVNLVGSSAYLDTLTIPVATSNTVWWNLYFPVNTSTSFNTTAHDVNFQITNGTVFTTIKIDGTITSGTTFTYSATTHRYLRFRESSGTIFLETSSDASSWTTRHSGAITIAIPLNRVDLAVITSSSNTGITVVGGINFPGPLDNAPLTGSGTLTLTAATPAFPVSMALSGSGVLSPVGSAPTASATAALTGSGTLSLASTIAFTGPGVLSGSGSLTGSASLVTVSGSASLSGSGALTPVASLTTASGARALSGSGSLTFTTALTASGATALAGSGALTLAALVSTSGSATLTGSGSLVTTGSPAFTVPLALSGTGALSFLILPSYTGSDTLSGSGTLTTTGTPDFPRALSLTGSGTLGTVGSAPSASAAASLSGAGSLVPAGTGMTASRAVPLTGAGVLSLLGVPAYSQPGVLSGSGQLVPVPTSITTSRAVPLSGSGTLAGAGTPAVSVSFVLAGSGTLVTAGSAPTASSAVPLNGSGTLVDTGTLAITQPLGLSGAGQLVVAQVSATAVAAAVLSGAGALTLTTTLTTTGSAQLSSLGVLGIATTVQTSAAVALTGLGALLEGVVSGARQDVPLSGAGALAVVVAINEGSPLSLSGAGALSLAGRAGISFRGFDAPTIYAQEASIGIVADPPPLVYAVEASPVPVLKDRGGPR
jgi:hypothetical protein